MRVAAVDLGTNSFLCLIAEVNTTGALKVLQDVSRVVRLGEGVHTNRKFLPEALQRAETCFKEFSEIIKKHKVEKILATATSSARDAANGDELLKLGKKYGLPIRIISGDVEAQLSFQGALSGFEEFKNKEILVVDVGGGSTELIYNRFEKDLKAISFDVGCVRLTEMFLKSDPVDEIEYKSLCDYAMESLRAFGKPNPYCVVAVAGTPTTLACVEQKIDFDETRVDGFRLSLKQIQGLSEKLRHMTLEQRKKVKGLDPLRADVIVAGAALLECALRMMDMDSLIVSVRGLRFGAALNYRLFDRP